MKELKIVERNEFNREGIIETYFAVWYGDSLVRTCDDLEVAESIYYNILNRTKEPSSNVIKQAYVSDNLDKYEN
jgi:hypothetical protein